MLIIIERFVWKRVFVSLRNEPRKSIFNGQLPFLSKTNILSKGHMPYFLVPRDTNQTPGDIY